MSCLGSRTAAFVAAILVGSMVCSVDVGHAGERSTPIRVTDPSESDPAETDLDDSEFEDVEFDDSDEAGGFDDLDLEDLMDIEVSLVSGSDTSVRETPAAVFVITQEDIRQGGFTTIPDALRMVPGLNVGQVSAGGWSVSARGLNTRFSAQMLVLIDGRAVYNDLFAGVFWEHVDYPLEDIERIEVIRGPGATIWGANAVNGVINIVTKSALDTVGTSARAGGGTHEKDFASIRHGVELSESFAFRVYGKHFNRNNYEFRSGANAHDDFDGLQAGFRLDGQVAERTSLLFKGDWYKQRRGEEGLLLTPTFPFMSTQRQKRDADGGNFLARFEYVDSQGKPVWSLQAFWDQDRLLGNDVRVTTNTYDVELRHFWEWGERHDFVWGVGFRHRRDETTPSFRVRFTPDDRSTDKYSAFVQDTITVVEDAFTLLAGAKVEKNEYTGWEAQPSLRGTWTVSERSTVWGAVSRAVRTPSRVEEDGAVVQAVIPPPPFAIPVQIVGDSRIDPEELLAYEAGIRQVIHEDLTADLAVFYNRYEDLITFSGPVPNVVATNAAEADAFGAELLATWQVCDRWRLHGSYAWLKLDVRGGDESDEDNAPENSFTLRSHVDVIENLSWEAAGYYVDHKPGIDVGSYVRFDTGLRWTPCENVHLSLFGQNLTESEHAESLDTFFVGQTIEIPRSVYGQIEVRF